MTFSRIAIVNRGEPAMRAINAVREYRAERRLDLKTIALFTDPDARSSFVREADEVYALGPATIDDRRLGTVSAYVHHETLQRALERSMADAVWTGWGFVAEDADFAELCGRLGLVTIGPSAEAMRLLGDKIASKRLAEESGVPVAPWSGGPVDTVEEAVAAATRIGFPVLLKATAGGGGRGIRKVASPDDLARAFEPARREAGSAFGNDTLFVESLVTNARHIEVQIVGDAAGTVWPVGVRDCSVQRRNQKIIEEAPSPALDEDEHAEVMAAAARLGASVGYQSAGTVEFLYQPATRRFSFMEVNTRLQVEHPITEVTTGADLVKLQLDLARGMLLEGDPPVTEGHAIEVRLNAEDPEAGFAPAPGLVELLRFPHGPGIRVDTGIDEGDEVVPQFDSMIAKLVVAGRDRNEAIARLRRALEQTTIVIRDGSTNKGFVQQLVDQPSYLDAEMDVGWVDRTVKPGELDQRYADIALLAAAIEGYEHQITIERLRFEAAATRGRPELELGDPFRNVALRRGAQSYEFSVSCVGPGSYHIEIDGQTIPVTTSDAGTGQRLTLGDRAFRSLAVKHGASMQIEVEGIGHRLTFDEGGVVRAPSPALVVSLDVAEGDQVSVGERLAVIEAMKMETTIAAEFSGTVREVLVRPNVQVNAGTPLLVIDITADSGPGAAVSRVDFSPLHDPPDPDHRRCVHKLEQLLNALLGYDIDVEPLVESMRDVRQCADQATEADRRKLEDQILDAFSDLIALFRQTPLEEGPIESLRRGAEGHLFDYLRDVEGRGEAQPDWFHELLRAALAHHQVNSLEPSPRLSAALFRLMRSRLLVEPMVPAILSILEDLIEHLGSPSNPQFREILDRLSNETVDRYPAIHDLATDIRYRLYDSPFLIETKERAYSKAQEQLAALRTGTQGAERDVLIDGLINCPQPLAPFLLRRIPEADLRTQQAMLEVITRRYYRIRYLENIQLGELVSGPLMTARYRHAESQINLIAFASSWADLPDALSEVAALAEQVPPNEDVVVDVHVVGSDKEGRADEMATGVNALLDEHFKGRTVRRVVSTISTSETSTSIASLFHFTFRPSDGGGYAEDRTYRDLHRMMAERLELWRLERFDTQRLPTLEDIYLFHGVAKDNPQDERLFAIAEVRDATRVTDTTDGSTRLPELERMFHEVVAAIRRVQSRRPRSRRLMWNRILLYVWPEIDLDREDMLRIVRRLAPYAEGAGLEKVVVLLKVSAQDNRAMRRVLEISDPSGHELVLRERDPAVRPLRTLTEHEQRMIRLRQRGLVDPFDVVRMLTTGSGQRNGGVAAGSFVEHDLAGDALIPVSRGPGENAANVVVGVISNKSARYPDGMSRVIILGDPSRGMGNLAEQECRRIIAALDLAERLHLPVEWFAVSAGARISMESGTENMDWIGRVLRRIIEFTQADGEVNVIVTGVNVGAQPYWNAEATMLMHTRGILVMMPQSAMVLTGKDALDFSGGVSAEDNIGIGGYARIMGPNGQAQYFATDLGDACRILLEHYEYTYVAPGERFPRRATTNDPADRDVGATPHGGMFETVGEIFDDSTNPGRKKPFDIRQVMAATVDRDLPTMERWYGMQHAEIAVVWDAFLGGHPVCLVGVESHPVTRTGFVPSDGPDQWTAGTLFPNASKKVARAINAASGNRPLVVLANLSGFDGSPESMRRLQLEYGAEIGRAVVNFDGPIVFCVISRYHGGAFVVFSSTLNDNMEVAALEGARASVIGGAPAAAVVFAREVSRRTELDPRVSELAQRVSEVHGSERAGLLGELNSVREAVRAEHMHLMANEFDGVHNVERARDVGSIDHIVAPSRLRPYLIEAVERGMSRTGRTTRTD